VRGERRGTPNRWLCIYSSAGFDRAKLEYKINDMQLSRRVSRDVVEVEGTGGILTC
jgi:hypothetical protein